METKVKKLQIDLQAFRSRNFCLYYIGQGISLTGTSITQVATSWLVYSLTNSAWLLGVVGFASQLPTLILIPFGGIVADRWNRHHILILAQILGMLQSLVLAWLTLKGSINVWHIVVLGVLQGIINAFDLPTRQAFLAETVDKKNLSNAIALYSSLVSVSSLLGPALTGVLILKIGSGLCFLIDGISYVGVIIGLLAMRFAPKKVLISVRKPLEELKASLTFAFSFLSIRSVLIGSALASYVWGTYTVLGPIFATDILHGGAKTFGLLMTASGIGTLAGGIYLSWQNKTLELKKILVFGSLLMGVSLSIFALSYVLWLSLFLLVSLGFGFILQVISSRTVLQLAATNENRGQIMGLYVMISTGAVLIGNIIAGALASSIGTVNTVIISASICIINSLFIYRADLSPISQKQ